MLSADCTFDNERVFYFSLLKRDPQSEINDWKERMFSVFQVSFNTTTMKALSFPIDIRIGEHAISRVFQRRQGIYNSVTNEFDIFKVLIEFKNIAKLGHAMIQLFNSVSVYFPHSLDNITIPFVSENGLFLGYFNKKLTACDVRTFVGNHQLAPKQAVLAEQVRNHLKSHHYSDTLPFALITPNKLSDFELAIFWARMNPVAHQFAELVTWNEENVSHKIRFQELVLNYIRSYEGLNEVLVEEDNAFQAQKDARQKKMAAQRAKKYARINRGKTINPNPA